MSHTRPRRHQPCQRTPGPPPRTLTGDSGIQAFSGWVYVAFVTDMFSRLVIGWQVSTRLYTDLALAALKMGIWRRQHAGEDLTDLVHHSNSPVLHRLVEPGTYTAKAFTKLCRQQGIRQSMGRVGSCVDDAAAEASFSSLEWEVLSRTEFATTGQARAVVLDWCYGYYNHQRRHNSASMMSPINNENATAPDRETA